MFFFLIKIKFVKYVENRFIYMIVIVFFLKKYFIKNWFRNFMRKDFIDKVIFGFILNFLNL